MIIISKEGETIYRKVIKQFTLDIGEGRTLQIEKLGEVDFSYGGDYDSNYEFTDAKSRAIYDALNDDDKDEVSDFIAELAL